MIFERHQPWPVSRREKALKIFFQRAAQEPLLQARLVNGEAACSLLLFRLAGIRISKAERSLLSALSLDVQLVQVADTMSERWRLRPSRQARPILAARANLLETIESAAAGLTLVICACTVQSKAPR